MSQDLTDNGRPWGMFDPQGQPVATGDHWHKWQCPSQKWEPAGYEHPFTGEWIDEGWRKVDCPWKNKATKLDVCTQCAMEFRYPGYQK